MIEELKLDPEKVNIEKTTEDPPADEGITTMATKLGVKDVLSTDSLQTLDLKAYQTQQEMKKSMPDKIAANDPRYIDYQKRDNALSQFQNNIREVQRVNANLSNNTVAYVADKRSDPMYYADFKKHSSWLGTDDIPFSQVLDGTLNNRLADTQGLISTLKNTALTAPTRIVSAIPQVLMAVPDIGYYISNKAGLIEDQTYIDYMKASQSVSDWSEDLKFGFGLLDGLYTFKNDNGGWFDSWGNFMKNAIETVPEMVGFSTGIGWAGKGMQVLNNMRKAQTGYGLFNAIGAAGEIGSGYALAEGLGYVASKGLNKFGKYIKSPGLQQLTPRNLSHAIYGSALEMTIETNHAVLDYMEKNKNYYLDNICSVIMPLSLSI
jgi:hypothetical protein